MTISILRSKIMSQNKAFHYVLGLFCVMMLIQKTTAIQFPVGEAKGWAVPDNSSTNSHNQWAERMRFQIGDSLLFVYNPDQDSVLQVKKEDYENCTTTSPLTKYTDGHTVFSLDRSGPYYFISGNKDNCLKNEKIVVVVLADRSNHSSPTNKQANSPPPPSPNVTAPTLAPASPPGGIIEVVPSPAPTVNEPTNAASSSSTFISVIGCIVPFFAYYSSFVLAL
ncbi:hypothetical protein K2173_009239 [Erythroxylum novogranatense]|uniref:Phytocyanin domain-containing protein n=1 Tax=Erythroxylum novogranatense TaxID=1862640 RepID=A0AAV8S5Q3_9ROSI|nr:hypothetical protein K2173_009239 [Erythroxylum novogranatense]